MISANPDSLLHPSRSAGFLLRNPFRMEFAFTLNDLGIRIVLSRMTEKNSNIIDINKPYVTPENARIDVKLAFHIMPSSPFVIKEEFQMLEIFIIIFHYSF